MTMVTVSVAGRPIDQYRALSSGHLHPLEAIVGYVVRQSVRDGVILPEGVDLAVFEGDTFYGSALETACASRDQRDYAVVDRLYRCGCRS